MRRRLLATGLFVAFGLCVEIAFTGAFEGARGSFRGTVSLLMVPVYALAWWLLGPTLAALRRADLHAPWFRLPITVALIYAIEWSFGAGYAAAGLRPWHYEHGWASDFSGGHITLLYLPLWLVFGAALPFVDRWIRRIARLPGASAPEARPGGSPVQPGRAGRAPRETAAARRPRSV